MSLHVKMLLVSVFGALLASCAAQPTQGPKPLDLDRQLAERHYLMGPPVDRIRNYQLSGWNYVDNHHVIMRAGVRDHYLITLRSYCPDLSSATSIAFSTTVGSLTTSDALLVRGPGSILDRCHIRYINRLEKIEDQG
ncbi:MAG: hypothetical protein HKN58_04825 [Xanthomonadales bacterium]|nr:hypothetical protein [Xanthomonadales bacterium]